MPSNPISSYKSVCQRKTLRLWVAFRDKCTPSPSVVKPMISCTTSEINRDKRSLPVRLGELPGRSLSFGTILPLYPPKTYSELLKTCGTGTGTAAGGNLLSQNLHQGFGENQCNNAYLSSVTLPGAGWILYFVVVPPLLVEHNSNNYTFSLQHMKEVSNRTKHRWPKLAWWWWWWYNENKHHKWTSQLYLCFDDVYFLPYTPHLLSTWWIIPL